MEELYFRMESISVSRGMNKKGQQMTLGTIIAIVLGIAVLVFLIFGFSTGWNNLWDKISGHTSTSNVQDKIFDCETDCSLGEKSSYCNEKKKLKFFDDDGKIVTVEATCEDFTDSDFEIKDKVEKGQIAEMGFSKCPSISC